LVQHDEQPAGRAPKKTVKKIGKIGAMLFVALIIFGAGWAGGSGRLRPVKAPSTVNASLPSKLDYSSLDTIYSLLRQNYDGKLNQNDLLEGAKEGLAKASGDPYTEYFTPKDAKEFQSSLDGSFEGIGAELGKDDQKNVIIISPLSGYPAEKAGLKPKDIVAKINGTSAYDLEVSQAVDKIRGPKGTKVKLTIVRDGQSPFDVEIERDKINIPSVTSKVDNGVGYLTISQFGADTATLAQKAAADFKAQNVKGVVLDLRGDPGGYLDAAVKVSSLWLQNKTVLTERRGGVIVHTYTSSGDSPLAGIPTVVLINEGSASASEITAGALHDNKAATLVGVKSFGKGSVQEPEQLSDGSMIKITIARWFTPNGKNIDKQGLDPDTKVALSDDDIKNGTDPQKDKATQIVLSSQQ
jgi:carboxyl-terminal processing protease